VFENLCPGKYNLNIIMEHYKGPEFSVELDCNGVKEIHKDLIAEGDKDSCCDGKIHIRVKDEDTKEALNGAKVTIWKDGKNIGEKIVVDGFVLFENLCEGKYGFDILKEGYKHIEFVIELGCNENKDPIKYLANEKNQDSCCNGKIYVIPRDAETEELLKGAQVNIFKDGAKIGSKIVEEGYVVFENLCPGKYNLNIIMEHYKGPEFSVELECNGVAEIHKDLIAEGDKDS
ncbi:MAG: hypothetical protein PF588_03080, partial [Candidatus Kapabacteria bacterium]|nr:hypothetical protein [Candidatus Kapabacteria bacterium]